MRQPRRQLEDWRGHRSCQTQPAAFCGHRSQQRGGEHSLVSLQDLRRSVVSLHPRSRFPAPQAVEQASHEVCRRYEGRGSQTGSSLAEWQSNAADGQASVPADNDLNRECLQEIPSTSVTLPQENRGLPSSSHATRFVTPAAALIRLRQTAATFQLRFRASQDPC